MGNLLAWLVLCVYIGGAFWLGTLWGHDRGHAEGHACQQRAELEAISAIAHAHDLPELAESADLTLWRLDHDD